MPQSRTRSRDSNNSRPRARAKCKNRRRTRIHCRTHFASRRRTLERIRRRRSRLQRLLIARNRIISGLSQATLVVQSRKKGGALITAQYCIDEGKLLLAIPGNFDCDLYSGTNTLLDSGHAKPVFIPENLRLAAGVPLTEGAKIEQLTTCGVELSSGAQKVLERFKGFRKTFSELQEDFGFKAPELLAILTELEISGLVTSKDNFQFYFNGA